MSRVIYLFFPLLLLLLFYQFFLYVIFFWVVAFFLHPFLCIKCVFLQIFVRVAADAGREIEGREGGGEEYGGNEMLVDYYVFLCGFYRPPFD